MKFVWESGLLGDFLENFCNIKKTSSLLVIVVFIKENSHRVFFVEDHLNLLKKLKILSNFPPSSQETLRASILRKSSTVGDLFQVFNRLKTFLRSSREIEDLREVFSKENDIYGASFP